MEKLTELIECGICANTKELLLFECQHRVCKDCVVKLQNKTVRISCTQIRLRIYCPFCRQPTYTSKNNATLPKCRLSSELGDLLKHNNESAPRYTSCATQTQNSSHIYFTGYKPTVAELKWQEERARIKAQELKQLQQLTDKLEQEKCQLFAKLDDLDRQDCQGVPNENNDHALQFDLNHQTL